MDRGEQEAAIVVAELVERIERIFESDAQLVIGFARELVSIALVIFTELIVFLEHLVNVERVIELQRGIRLEHLIKLDDVIELIG